MSTASTDTRIHIDIDRCIQIIRINCDRRIKLLTFVLEDACLDEKDIVWLQYVIRLRRVLPFLAR